MKKLNYFDERSQKCTLKLREILRTSLPEFCDDFFIGIENQTSPLTRLNYARDLVIFFEWLKSYTSIVNGKEIKDLTIDDLKKITSNHIDRFLRKVRKEDKNNEFSNWHFNTFYRNNFWSCNGIFNEKRNES